MNASLHRAIAALAMAVAWMTAACAGRQRLPLPLPPPVLATTSEDVFLQPPDPLPATRMPTVPHVHESTLSNGMTLVFVRAADLPLVSVQLVCRAGGHEDRDVGRGVDELLEDVLDDLAHDTAPELLGTARPTAEVTGTAVWLSSDAASDQLETIVRTMALLARSPAITDESVQTARRPLFEDIRLGLNGSRAMLETHERLLIYGDADVRSRPWYGDLASLRRIGAADLVARHARLFAPSATALVVVGDAELDDVRALAEAAFAGWSAPEIVGVPLPTPAFATPHARLHAIPTGGDESEVLLREHAPTREDPDRPAFEVLTALLGGMFGARINRILREERGHTYGIHTSIEDHRNYALIRIDLAVPSTHMRSTVFAVIDELRRVQEASAIEDDELSRARATALAAYRTRFSSRAAIAVTLGGLFARRATTDALLARAAAVSGVTSADVARVAHTWLRPEAAPILVIGTYRNLYTGTTMIPGGSELVIWRW